MKIIIRILAIVAVALVVVGAAVGIAQLSGSNTSSSRGQAVSDVQFDPATAPAAGFHVDGGGDRGGDTGFGLQDLGANLFKVGWVLVAGALALRGAKLLENTLRRRQRVSVTPS